VVIVVTPFAGALSDRAGRRFTLLLFGTLSVALPSAMFAFMADGSALRAVTGAVVPAMVAGSISAVGTAATAVFGGLAPYLAQTLTDGTGWAPAPGALVAAVAVAVLSVLWWMPETAPGRAKSPRVEASGTQHH